MLCNERGMSFEQVGRKRRKFSNSGGEYKLACSHLHRTDETNRSFLGTNCVTSSMRIGDIGLMGQETMDYRMIVIVLILEHIC